ncbi:MAG: hypothetical protein SFW09_15575 [Hyphomicrobiaceae bacterium]|nr:hypothetical protein [Hyphomicrobiaceae bacterium]
MSRPIVIETAGWPAGAESVVAFRHLESEADSARGLQQALADLGPAQPIPPPPRPLRSLSPNEPEIAPELRSAVPPPLPPVAHEPPPPMPVMTTEEIVRALAKVGNPHEPTRTEISQVHTPTPADDHDDRPPMIIERALAEQNGSWALTPAPRPSPWPGLATGFSLATLVGAALYAILSSA